MSDTLLICVCVRSWGKTLQLPAKVEVDCLKFIHEALPTFHIPELRTPLQLLLGAMKVTNGD